MKKKDPKICQNDPNSGFKESPMDELLEIPCQVETGKVNVSGITERRTAHILIIDDEVDFIAPVRMILKAKGHSVSVCNNGQSGVDYYFSHFRDIDAVLLDVNLPDMDVRNILRALVYCNPEVKVVICSGSIFGTELEEIRSMIHGVLEKPFTMEQLLEIVDSILET